MGARDVRESSRNVPRSAIAFLDDKTVTDD